MDGRTLAAASLAAAIFLADIRPVGASDASDAQVMAIVQQHCAMCHARKPTHPSFDAPPKDVVLETVDELRAWAVKVMEQAVLNRNMPIGLETGMTEAERATLARWIGALMPGLPDADKGR